MSATVAILGAGVAGASAARALADRGTAVRVYDKGRVPGGRATTRMRAGAHFDHGAQYFTARDPAFVATVQTLRARGIVQRWQPRLVALDSAGVHEVASREERWVAQPGMAALAAALLEGIDLRCSQRVVGCARDARGWWLELADGRRDGPFAGLLCTLPATQAVDLLQAEPVASTAAEIRFAPCWALMLAFDQPLDLDFDAAFVNAGPLSWIARDSSKPGRPAGERWLVHAGAEFSRAHLEASAEEVAPRMLQSFFETTGATPVAPAGMSAHRWRYALADAPLRIGALADDARRIALGGDWCCGSRIEGAWLSGQALAKQALAWMDAPGAVNC